MTPTAWSSFVIVALIQAINPGPTATLLLLTGMKEGRSAALSLIPGFFLGDLCMIIGAFIITTGVVAASRNALIFIQIIGGAYLILLGLMSLRIVANDANCITPVNRIKSLARGFTTTILNPKGLLFYITFFPQFTSQHESYTAQFLMLGAIFLLITVLIDFSYAVGSAYATRVLRPGMIKFVGVVAALSIFATGVFLIIWQAYRFWWM